MSRRQAELAGMAQPAELTDGVAPPTKGLRDQRIRRGATSKRAAVTEFQARTMALLIETIESAALRRFEVPDASRLQTTRHEEFFALPEYRLFIEGSYACGFVCRDFSPEGPVIDRPALAERIINAWSFYELRHHIHVLLRSERWADGYSSPVLESLAQGALSAIGQRLVSDDALYETY